MYSQGRIRKFIIVKFKAQVKTVAELFSLKTFKVNFSIFFLATQGVKENRNVAKKLLLEQYNILFRRREHKKRENVLEWERSVSDRPTGGLSPHSSLKIPFIL